MARPKGFTMSQEQKTKIGQANKGRKYEPFAYSGRNGWKGDSVGYYALHAWVKRCLGKPTECTYADETCKGRLEWANKNHSYNRNLDDFISLCISHHRRFDGVIPDWISK